MLFKRMRQWRLPLAVKCQLLFGGAGVLIIAAALFWPWQRMQQLTDQLNRSAAAAVATNVVAEHVERETSRLIGPGSTTQPSAIAPDTRNIDRAPIVIEGQSYAAPRLVATSDRAA